MDLHQIRSFLAVAEELHFGRAAERLHIAQPPLSRTIKHLEHELGIQLFERNTRSVSLTPSGQALLGPAKEVMTALRRAELAVRLASNGEVGLIRIAFAGVSTHRLVARLARAVRTRHPGIQLELSSQNFAQPAMRKLVWGDTDIALGRWDVIPGDVAAEIVMPDALVIAVPDTHTLAGADRVHIGQLADDGFVSLLAHEGAVLPDRLGACRTPRDLPPISCMSRRIHRPRSRWSARRSDATSRSGRWRATSLIHTSCSCRSTQMFRTSISGRRGAAMITDLR